jgi:hypothetical protein
MMWACFAIGFWLLVLSLFLPLGLGIGTTLFWGGLLLMLAGPIRWGWRKINP